GIDGVRAGVRVPDIGFLFVSVWNSDAEVLVEEHSLRHPGYFHCGRGYHADAGCHDHADFHGTDAGPVFCGDRGVGNGGAQEGPAVGRGDGACQVSAKRVFFVATSGLALVSFFLAACNGKPIYTASATVDIQPEAQNSTDDAPPADKTGGFDGKRAFAHVAKQVGFGPRPSGSPAIGQLQEYIQNELTSYGCKVDVDSFT